MTDPYRNTSALRPLGLPCPMHSSMVVGGKCYWHIKSAHLQGQSVPLVGRQRCGFDLPQPDPAWNTHRGWRSAEVLRSASLDAEEREVARRGIRWLIDLGDTRGELSV